MVDQLGTIFTCLEIKRNKLLEFENDKSSDLCARRHNESYDETGTPNMLADSRETAQKHMTKYSIPTRKMTRGSVLDSPSKGKTTETSVVEGTMSIVQPALRTS